MSKWETIKADPDRLKKHKESSKNYAKNRYNTDSEYREKMKKKARERKAMLKERKDVK
jgi:hypothetical protein